MDYSRFRFKAVCDWIEVQIKTEQPTAYDAIKRHSGLPFVEPQDPAPFGKGKSSTVFNIKIHDPANWAQVVKIVANIAEKYELSKPFEVVGVEVALDAIPRSGAASMLELATMAAHLAKHSTFHHKNVRLYRKGRKNGDFTFMSVDDKTTVRHMAEGWQHMRGDKESDCYQHTYAKVTDHNKKALSSDQHRARMEITLCGDKLLCSTLDEWNNNRFEKLAKPYFTYRKYKTGDNTITENGSMNMANLRESMYQHQPNFGKRKTQRATPRERLTNKLSVADKELNDLARHALQGLSERWKCKKARDFKSLTTCNETKHVRISNNYTIEQLQEVVLELDELDEHERKRVQAELGHHQEAIEDHFDSKAKGIDEAYRETMNKIAADKLN